MANIKNNHEFINTFSTVISEKKLLDALSKFHKKAGGRPPSLSIKEIVMSLVYHAMQPSGVLSEHVLELTGKEISDSSISERRQSFGVELHNALVGSAFTLLATQQENPDAFYCGMRLIGFDGTTANVANTPQIKNKVTKTKSRKGESAFYRITASAVYELGVHNPIAVEISISGESEMVLTVKLLASIPPDCLAIFDRYYGNGKFIGLLTQLKNQPAFLIRVKNNLKPNRGKKLSDGSRIVGVWNSDQKQFIPVREIRARVRRNGEKWTSIRIWTSLLDEKKYPAEELIRLYTIRWEQEIAFKEVKEHLINDNILLSHTLITAAQELSSIFIAQAIIARMRSGNAKSSCTPILQISFQKTLEGCRYICIFDSILFGLVDDQVRQIVFERIMNFVCRQSSKKRRNRSCPRKVRQPIGSWHRLTKNTYCNGALQYQLLK